MRPESGARHRFDSKALVVEDDDDLRANIADALCCAGFSVVSCKTAQCMKVALSMEAIAVLVLDLTLPDEFGGDLLAALARRPDAPPTVVASGFSLAHLVGEKYGLEVVIKPFSTDQLVAAVSRAIRTQRR